MSKGLSRTINHLLRSRNDAVIEVLIAGLESSHPSIRSRAINCLARRRQTACHHALMKRLSLLGEEGTEQLVQIDHRMHESLKEALQGNDELLCESAAKLALILGEYDLFAAMIDIAEDIDHPASNKIAVTIVRLATQLREESDLPPQERTKQDPFFARRKALDRLGKSINSFHKHKRLEILDAFLLLTSFDHPAFKTLLENPNHPCHDQLLSTLKTSRVPGIIRLLVDFMRDRQTPLTQLKLFAERVDIKFLSTAIASISSPVPLRVLENMGRLKQVSWLEAKRSNILKLPGPQQAVAVQLATASGIEHFHILEFLVDMMEKGAAEARQACCHALDEFRSPQADSLIRQGLEDDDPQVRAAATAQLRRRSLPGALPKLLSLIDSDTDEVREAARSSLTEYKFTSYVSAYAEMNEQQRHIRGEIVGKCDAKAIEGLRREFSSPSRSIRLRATEMVYHLRLIDPLVESLTKLLLDTKEDLAIRAGSAEALALSNLNAARDAIQKATHDPQPVIRNLALKLQSTVRVAPLTVSPVSDLPGAPTS